MELQDIITKAWEDDVFKKQLIADPKGTISRELGVSLPDGIEIFIHEQTPTQLHLILPMKPDLA